MLTLNKLVLNGGFVVKYALREQYWHIWKLIYGYRQVKLKWP